MITIILVHPQHSTPIQSWKFEHEAVISIGRAADNQVVLYSAVVSRYHAQLRQANKSWEIVNLGANGTYLEGQRLTESAPVVDGAIVRLAQSGPQLQIRFEAVPVQPVEKSALQQQ